MNRRDFLYFSAAVAPVSSAGVRADSSPRHHFPEQLLRRTSYIEEISVPEYHHAPQSAYEAFRDMKFGVRTY